MSDITNVSFPGLGIGDLELNKIAFTLFGKLEVRWYGIFLTLGIVLAFLYVIWRGKYTDGIKSDDIIDIGIVTVVLGIIGARTYYVLTTLDTHRYESFYDVIAIWNGGIAVYGSIIGGGIGAAIVCYFKKINILKFFDMIVPGLIIAQAIGRWGNFVNGEAHGYIIARTTQMDFLGNMFTLPSGEGTFFNTFRMGLLEQGEWVYYHPTFLYESVWNTVGFVILNLFYKHKSFHGQTTLLYFAWYGLGRMFIEGFRTDSLYLPGTELRISQLVGLIGLVAGAALFIIFAIKCKNNDPFADVVLETGKNEEEAPAAPSPMSIKLKAFWSRLTGKGSAEETKEAPTEQAKDNTDTEGDSKVCAPEQTVSDNAEGTTDSTQEAANTENTKETEETNHGTDH